MDTKQESSISVINLANILFNKPINSLEYDLARLIIDDSMDIVDVFCMLVELVLYGLDILTSNCIFDLIDSSDNIVDIIDTYLKSVGFTMTLIQSEYDYNYCDSTDYYCEILPKPPAYLCYPGWYVLTYRIRYNDRSDIANPHLSMYKAIFVANKQLFTIHFDFYRCVKI